MSYPEELLRTCPYCGESFIANHGLRQFCPEKHGRANFCKHQYKALLNEARLLNPSLKAISTTSAEKDPIKKNETILKSLLGTKKERVVSKDLLEAYGYRLDIYWHKYPESDGGYHVTYGPLWLEEIEQTGPIRMFRIS